MQEIINNDSNIIIEKRKKITVNGVKDCLSFEEETIILNTVLGKLTVKGLNLHIINFDTASGEFTAEGKINAAVYTFEERKTGFLGRLFK